MSTKEELTLALAIWGALLSTFLAVLTIRREWREEGKLRVGYWLGRTTSVYTGITPRCIFEVVNVGRRPVYFYGLTLADRKGRSVDFLGPIEIEEGAKIKLEPGDAWENVKDEAYNNADRLLRAHRIYASDTRGRRAYLPWWRVWRLHRDVRQIKTAHEAFLQRRAASSENEAI